MANTLLTIDMITRETLRVLKNNLVLTRNVNRQYDSSYAQAGAKIGATLRVRLPNRYLVTDGPTLSVQNDIEQYTTVTASTQKHVGMAFTSAEMALSLDEFSNRIIKPAASQLAATIDADVANAFKYFGQSVGTAGTTPATSAVLLAAMQKLNESAAPMDSRFAVVNPAANAGLVEGMKGLFNPTGVISKQFKSGMMGEGILGLDELAMSQSIGNFTTGSRSAGATLTTTVAAQGQTTLAITTNGASDTIKLGDVFTIGSVYAVNPQTRQTTGSLYQFVALADATASGSAVTVTVAPIYWGTNQALATVDSVPTAAAAITFMGGVSTAYPQNIIAHKDAITFASVDLPMPTNGGQASRVNDSGISLRLIKDWYDPINDRMITRLDVLYGWAVLRPELAVRLWG